MTTAERLQKKLGTEKAKKVLAILEKQKLLRMHTARQEKQKQEKISQEKKKEKQKAKQKDTEKDSSSSLPFYLLFRSERTDRDKDGLTDAEEKYIGTDPNAADTDRDGYSDFIEVEFGISPLKKDPSPVLQNMDSEGSMSAVSRLFFYGLFEGLFSQKYGAETNANRMIFSVLLVRIFASPHLPDVAESPFVDVEKYDWYLPYLVALQQNKIELSGSDNRFRPLEPVTRAEACLMTLQMANVPFSSFLPDELVFYDTNSTNAGAVGECARKKLLLPKKKEEHFFGANDFITRGEMARLFLRTVTSYK